MADEGGQLDGHARRFLAALPPAHALTLDIAGCAIRVTSNSPSLVAALRHYYRAQWVDDARSTEITVSLLEGEAQQLDLEFTVYPPAPGKTRVKDEYVDYADGRLLRKRATRMLFLFGPQWNVAVGPCEDNLNQVVNFINNRFIDRQVRRGYLLCHAAGVARADRGIAVAGLAGRGKSTLCLHLLNRGLDFVSNDRLMIRRSDRHMEMVGLPKHPRVNPGTLLHNPALEKILTPGQKKRFSALPHDELWALEYKFDVDIEETFGPGRYRLAAPMVGAVILSWRPDTGPMRARAVDLRKRDDLLAALAKSPGVHYRRLQGAPKLTFTDDDYVAVLRDCPVYEIAGGVDFDAAAAACLDLLDHGALPDASPTAHFEPHGSTGAVFGGPAAIGSGPRAAVGPARESVVFLPARCLMNKKDIGVKSAIRLDQAVAYLQDIVNSLKQKKVCVEHRGESLVLNPPDSVTVEVKARQKSGKESISLKIGWLRPTEADETDPELTISAKEPTSAPAGAPAAKATS